MCVHVSAHMCVCMCVCEIPQGLFCGVGSARSVQGVEEAGEGTGWENSQRLKVAKSMKGL